MKETLTTETTLRDSPESSRVRLTLDLSKRLNAIVSQIADEKETSKADVLRMAIEFLARADAAEKEGMHVVARTEKQDGRVMEREISPY